jgi:hypothetical protein
LGTSKNPLFLETGSTKFSPENNTQSIHNSTGRTNPTTEITKETFTLPTFSSAGAQKGLALSPNSTVAKSADPFLTTPTSPSVNITDMLNNVSQKDINSLSSSETVSNTTGTISSTEKNNNSLTVGKNFLTEKPGTGIFSQHISSSPGTNNSSVLEDASVTSTALSTISNTKETLKLPEFTTDVPQRGSGPNVSSTPVLILTTGRKKAQHDSEITSLNENSSVSNTYHNSTQHPSADAPTESLRGKCYLNLAY